MTEVSMYIKEFEIVVSVKICDAYQIDMEFCIIFPPPKANKTVFNFWKDGRWPSWKTTLMEDDLNSRTPFMEDNSPFYTFSDSVT